MFTWWHNTFQKQLTKHMSDDWCDTFKCHYFNNDWYPIAKYDHALVKKLIPIDKITS